MKILPLCVLVPALSMLVGCTSAPAPLQITTPIPRVVASPDFYQLQPTPATVIEQPSNSATNYLKCEAGAGEYECRDQVLNVDFAYPQRWGAARSILTTSTAAQAWNHTYSIEFDMPALMQNGGVGSWNGETGRGKSPTEFGGGEEYEGRKGLCQLASEYICHEPRPNVMLQLHLPGADEVCAGQPLTEPDFPGIARVMVNLPDNIRIGGFILITPFVSGSNEKVAQLLVAASNGQCDGETRAAIEAWRNGLAQSIVNGTADAETMQIVNELRQMTDSIQPHTTQ